jgi:hypothetical protein
MAEAPRAADCDRPSATQGAEETRAGVCGGSDAEGGGMTTFKVGDRVRLKPEESEYALACGLTGELVIAKIDGGDVAGFLGHPGGALLSRLEHIPAPAVPTIDPAKQYRTRDGREVLRVLATDLPGPNPVSAIVKEHDGTISQVLRRADGTGKSSKCDLIEVKPERTAWVNIYDGVGLYATKDDANRAACEDRIACIKVTFREGEGLDG